MESVLISIKPKWCGLIANGKKTVEIRKTKPKIETPFKVYIYQTRNPESVAFSGTGRHISEYDKICYYTERSGKVIGEFVCDRVIDIPSKDLSENFRRLIKDIITPSCLEVEELKNYLGYKDGYGWHISNLIIYDKPRKLNQFVSTSIVNTNCFGQHLHKLDKPPQSWCYAKYERSGK